MAVLIALVVGLVLWIVGWALTGSTHAGFDWFLPAIAFVLLAVVGRAAAGQVRKMLRP